MPAILPNHKAIFFHIPKTGGMRIASYLFRNTSVIAILRHRPPRQVRASNTITSDIIKDYWKFTFIRNP